MVRGDILIHYLPEQLKQIDSAIKATLKFGPGYFPGRSPIALPKPQAVIPNDVVGVSIGISDIGVKSVAKNLCKLR